MIKHKLFIVSALLLYMRKSTLTQKLEQSQKIVADAECQYRTSLLVWKAAMKEQEKINRSGDSTQEIEKIVKAKSDTMFYCLRVIKEENKHIEWYESKLLELSGDKQ